MWLNKLELDFIVHGCLEKVEFHHSALSGILMDLCSHGAESPFYREVLGSDHFKELVCLKEQNQMFLVQREGLHQEFLDLSKKMDFLESEKNSIKNRLVIY
jgi:hypothetical protein